MIGALAKRCAFSALEKLEHGRLRLTTPDGVTRSFGQSGPEADLHILDWRTLSAAMLHGDVGFGEAYVEGWWESSDLEALAAFAANDGDALASAIGGQGWSQAVMTLADSVVRANSRRGSKRNIAAHYDVGNDFYRLWLDEGLTYSSALYDQGATSLGEAQNRKYDRLIDASRGEGARTLEIGCGWGGFAERAAEAGRDVTAITISEAQHAFASKRLGKRADVKLTDYRDVRGTFDSIVSIEMVEAVGERYWPTYFGTIKQRLAEGGRAALQAITVGDDFFPEYRKRSDFIRRHVFPGGMLLAPGKISEAAAGAGLKAENLFSFGRDYARTLREWLVQFEAANADIRALGYSERFIRSWRFYLASCAALFETGKTDVVHVELCHAA